MALVDDVGHRLQKSRNQAGYDVKELAWLAREMGYRTTQSFYDAESGRRKPSKRLIEVYSRFCGFQEGGIETRSTQSGDGDASHTAVANLFKSLPGVPATSAKLMRSRAHGFLRANDSSSPISLETPDEVTDAALHLILARAPRGFPDEIQIVQRAAISAWGSLQEPEARRLVPNAIRTVVGRGCRVYHTISSATLGKNRNAEEALRRYTELQMLPGDYELTRDDTPPRSGATDTIVRPGVGVLHAMVQDATGLSVSGGDFFGHRCSSSYVARRSSQAKQLVRGRSGPFRVHDPSGSYSSEERRVRVENALVELESIEGPRIVLGDGLSDLLAPQEVYVELTRSLATTERSSRGLVPQAPQDEYWLAELAQCHEERLTHFRRQVGRFLFSDFTPKAALDRTVRESLHPRLVSRQLNSMAEYLETFENYRLFLLEDDLGEAILGSGIGIIVKQGKVQGEPTWQLFFESNSFDPHHRGIAQTANRQLPPVSVSFQTGLDRYRLAYQAPIERLVENQLADYDRGAVVRQLRGLALVASERAV